MKFPGITAFLEKYQPRGAAAGADALGFYLPPYAYAGLQVLASAVEATKGVDQKQIAEYIHANTFKTVVGDITFGKDGEWLEERVLFIQYRGLTGNDLEQFKKPGTEVILYPAQYKSGDIEAPYTDIKH